MLGSISHKGARWLPAKLASVPLVSAPYHDTVLTLVRTQKSNWTHTRTHSTPARTAKAEILFCRASLPHSPSSPSWPFALYLAAAYHPPLGPVPYYAELINAAMKLPGCCPGEGHRGGQHLACSPPSTVTSPKDIELVSSIRGMTMI